MNEASTITMTASLTSSVNIKIASEILSVIHPRNPDGSKYIHPKNTRNKIPYFGVENVIVCVKYKNRIRGIRQNEGQMNNVVSVDLQISKKNINLKLAKNEVQLTGATSDNMGKNAFLILCSHIMMIQGHLNYIRSLSQEVRDASMNWVIENTKPILDDENNKVIPPFDYDRVISSCNQDQLLDTKFLIFLWQFADEFETYEQYLNQLNVITNIINSNDNIIPESNEISITDCKISNSVYNYNIGQEISLIGLTKFLHGRGFSVSFHNWNSTQLKVSIPILEDENTIETSSTTESEPTGTISSTTSKIRAHRFSIHRGGGSIKQTSPSDSFKAAEARKVLLEAISEYIEN